VEGCRPQTAGWFFKNYITSKQKIQASSGCILKIQSLLEFLLLYHIQKAMSIMILIILLIFNILFKRKKY